MIHEPFAPLPCSGTPGHRTALQEEGCAERQILRTDARLDRLSTSIFSLFRTKPPQRSFIAAQGACLAYRRADCLSVSDVFEGGTLAFSSTRSARRAATNSESGTYVPSSAI